MNTSTQRDSRGFRTSRFVFESLDKFVVMDVFLKVTLDDLKFSFQKILGMDFFSKKFEYFLIKDQNDRLNYPIDSSILLEDDESIRECLKDSNKELQFKVKFKDIGA